MVNYTLSELNVMALKEMPILCRIFKNGDTLALDDSVVLIGECISAVNGFFKDLIRGMLAVYSQNGIVDIDSFSDRTIQEKLYALQLHACDMEVLQEAVNAADELMTQYPENAKTCGTLYHKKLNVLFSKNTLEAILLGKDKQDTVDVLNNIDALEVFAVMEAEKHKITPIIRESVVLTREQLQSFLDIAYQRGINRATYDAKHGTA